jgi:NitT/TauT family transport system permease protein
MSGQQRLATDLPAWRWPALPALRWRLVRPVVLPILFAAALLLAWQELTVHLHVSSMLLVPPTAIWDLLAESWPILLAQSWPTLINTVVGFLMAAILGIAIGGAVVVSRRAWVRAPAWPSPCSCRSSPSPSPPRPASGRLTATPCCCAGR